MIPMKGQQSVYIITSKLGCATQVWHVPFLQRKTKFHCTTGIPFGPRGAVVTPDERLCVLSGALYMMLASVGIGSTVMHPDNVLADTCLWYNLIARRCLPRGLEHCSLKDCKIPSFAAADKTPLSCQTSYLWWYNLTTR